MPDRSDIVGSATIFGGRPSATTRATPVVRVNPWPVPVIVSGKVPVGVTPAVVVTLIPEEAEVVGLVLNAAVLPAGRPVTASATSEGKFVRAIPTFAVAAVWPCLTCPEAAALRVKMEYACGSRSVPL